MGGAEVAAPLLSTGDASRHSARRRGRLLARDACPCRSPCHMSRIHEGDRGRSGSAHADAATTPSARECGHSRGMATVAQGARGRRSPMRGVHASPRPPSSTAREPGSRRTADGICAVRYTPGGARLASVQPSGARQPPPPGADGRGAPDPPPAPSGRMHRCPRRARVSAVTSRIKRAVPPRPEKLIARRIGHAVGERWLSWRMGARGVCGAREGQWCARGPVASEAARSVEWSEATKATIIHILVVAFCATSSSSDLAGGYPCL